MSKISLIESLEEKIRKMEFKKLMLVNDICQLKNQLESCEEESKKITLEYSIESLTEDYGILKKDIGKFDDDLKKLKGKEKGGDGNQGEGQIFTPFTFSELLSQPPKQWIVENVMGKGDLGLIYGSPGCGKTFVVIDLIFALCQSGQWAGRFKVDGPLSVAYCAGEGFSGLPARFNAIAAHHNVEQMPSFTFFRQIPQLYDDSVIPETIGKFVNDWSRRQHKKECEPLDVLIIDTFHSAIVGADENSSSDIGVIIQACKKAIEVLNCAIVMVHHTTKDGAVERGSGAIRGAMEFMIKVEKVGRDDSNQGRIHCSKVKDAESWNPQNFELIRPDNQLSCHVQWDSPVPANIINQSKTNCEKFKITQILSKNPLTGFTVKSISDALGLNIDYVRRVLIDMAESNIIGRRLNDPSKDSSNRNPWIYFHKI